MGKEEPKGYNRRFDSDDQPTGHDSMTRALIAALLSALLLAGCGQKGDLYLPPASSSFSP